KEAKATKSKTKHEVSRREAAFPFCGLFNSNQDGHWMTTLKEMSSRLLGAWKILAGRTPRKSVVLPSIPRSGGRQPLPKPSPANLRRFGETPVARKAINTIKDRIAGMRWRIQVKGGSPADTTASSRTEILRGILEAPNPDDSFRSLTEQVL